MSECLVCYEECGWFDDPDGLFDSVCPCCRGLMGALYPQTSTFTDREPEPVLTYTGDAKDA